MPLEKWLQDSTSVRVEQLRFNDEAMAVKAGRAVSQNIRARLRKEKNIPYDFKMRAFEYSEFFCTELVYAAFDWASGGKVQVPELQTSLKKFEGHRFLQQMGIEARMTFAPGDIEADRRFRMIREWRHVARVKDTKSPFFGMSRLTQVRIQDAAVTSIFDWMFTYNYEFRFDLGSWGVSNMAKGLLKMDIGTNFVQKHVPEKFIAATLRIIVLTDLLQQKMIAEDKKYRAENGMGIGFQELLDINEAYRKQDCQVYKKFSSWSRMPNSRMPQRANPNRAPDFHYRYRTLNSGDVCAL